MAAQLSRRLVKTKLKRRTIRPSSPHAPTPASAISSCAGLARRSAALDASGQRAPHGATRARDAARRAVVGCGGHVQRGRRLHAVGGEQLLGGANTMTGTCVRSRD